MGEAKRRREYMARTGRDWDRRHRPHAPCTSKRSAEIHGKTPEEIAAIDKERADRRGLDRAKRAGLIDFISQGASKLSESALKRLGNIRAQMKKRGASAAARRAAR